jgi:hypothetical protein
MIRGDAGPVRLQAAIAILVSELVLLAMYGLVVVLRRDDRVALLARASRVVRAS